MSKGNETFDRFKAGDRVKEKIGQGRFQAQPRANSLKAIRPGRQVSFRCCTAAHWPDPTSSCDLCSVKWDAPELDPGMV